MASHLSSYWASHSAPNMEFEALIEAIPPESRNFQITSTTLTTLRSLTAARPASTPWLDVAEHDISISMRDGHVNRARVFSPTSNLAPDQKSSAEDEGKQDGGRRPLFVMLYGGGFVMGRIEAEAEGLRRWVRKYGGVGVGIEHRHSPEHKFPGPIEDAHDAVKWISQNAKSLGADPTHGFILGGTSSGATAMTAISHLLRDEGHTPKVTGLLLSVPSMCVVLEIPERYREKVVSWEQNKDGPIFNRATSDFLHDTVQASPNSPMRSPLLWPTGHANLSPTYFSIAGGDPVRDVGLLYEQILREENGIQTRVDVWNGLPHGFFNVFPKAEFSKAYWERFEGGLGWLLGVGDGTFREGV